MGKRKSSKPPPKKAAAKLDTVFNCPFCNSHKSVSCHMDYEREMASLKCSSCGEGFQAPMNHLTEPVDVWHEWLDECDKEDHNS